MLPPTIPVLLDMTLQHIASSPTSILLSMMIAMLDTFYSTLQSVFVVGIPVMLNVIYGLALATPIPQVSFVNPATAPSILCVTLVIITAMAMACLSTRSRTLRVSTFLIIALGSLCTLVVLPEILPRTVVTPHPLTMRTLLQSVSLCLRILHTACASAAVGGLAGGSSEWASIVPGTIDWSQVSYRTSIVSLTRTGALVDLFLTRHSGDVVRTWRVGGPCSLEELLCIASHVMRRFLVVLNEKTLRLSFSDVPCAGFAGYHWASASSESLISRSIPYIVAACGFIIVVVYMHFTCLQDSLRQVESKLALISSSTASLEKENKELVIALAQCASKTSALEETFVKPPSSLSTDHQNLIVHLAQSALTIADLQWRFDQSKQELNMARTGNVFSSSTSPVARKFTPIKSKYLGNFRLASTPVHRRFKTRSKASTATCVPISTSSSTSDLPITPPRTAAPSASAFPLPASPMPTPIKRARAAHRTQLGMNMRRLLSRRVAESARDARPMWSPVKTKTAEKEKETKVSIRKALGTNMRQMLSRRIARHPLNLSPAAPLTSTPPKRIPARLRGRQSISSHISESIDCNDQERSSTPSPARETPAEDSARAQAGAHMRKVLLARVARAKEAADATPPPPPPSPPRSSLSMGLAIAKSPDHVRREARQVIASRITESFRTSAQWKTSTPPPPSSSSSSRKPVNRHRKARSSSSQQQVRNRRPIEGVMANTREEHRNTWRREGEVTQQPRPTVGRHGDGPGRRVPLSMRYSSTPAPIRIPSRTSSTYTSSSRSGSSSGSGSGFSSRSSSTTPTSATSTSTFASSIASASSRRDKFSMSPSPSRNGTVRAMLVRNMRDALSRRVARGAGAV
ncbi:hypothetical protein BD410DRAFT_636980 [Rickenella mellea]|uniref:Uncharacterized protein n=1 Tax=Rickenella mellea TaxID=50990 RepID=A0A4Y7QDS5_9AGAM|nr:hypothetical protein BD410DRAFT_636980 [Rickenella mellea]